MKKSISIFFLMVSIYGYSQKHSLTNKFSYHSFSVTPLGGYFDADSGGFAFSADVSFRLRKNVFSIGFLAGAEFNILGSSNSFEQVNLLYGQEFNIFRNLFLDLHAGAGYFSFSSTNREQNRLIDGRTTTIGFPVISKFRIITCESFSMGLQLQANINSVRNIYSMGIVLQWNKRR